MVPNGMSASAPWMWFFPRVPPDISQGCICLHCPLVVTGSEHQTGAGVRGERKDNPLAPNCDPKLQGISTESWVGAGLHLDLEWRWGGVIFIYVQCGVILYVIFICSINRSWPKFWHWGFWVKINQKIYPNGRTYWKNQCWLLVFLCSINRFFHVKYIFKKITQKFNKKFKFF